jgi:hypothetical protein
VTPLARPPAAPRLGRWFRAGKAPEAWFLFDNIARAREVFRLEAAGLRARAVAPTVSMNIDCAQ